MRMVFENADQQYSNRLAARQSPADDASDTIRKAGPSQYPYAFGTVQPAAHRERTHRHDDAAGRRQTSEPLLARDRADLALRGGRGRGVVVGVGACRIDENATFDAVFMRASRC